MKFLMLFCLFIVAPLHAKGEVRVLMVVNEGFRPEEFYAPKKIFEKEGYRIKVATRFGKSVRPGQKYPDIASAEADLSFPEIKARDYDVITFSGGGGAWSDFFPDKNLHQLLIGAVNDKKTIVGLICVASGLLAMSANFDGETPQFSGRKVTGYPEVKGILKGLGKLDYSEGDPLKPYVVVDGNLVTGRDPMASELFGLKIVELVSKGP